MLLYLVFAACQGENICRSGPRAAGVTAGEARGGRGVVADDRRRRHCRLSPRAGLRDIRVG